MPSEFTTTLKVCFTCKESDPFVVSYPVTKFCQKCGGKMSLVDVEISPDRIVTDKEWDKRQRALMPTPVRAYEILKEPSHKV